jgi:hypothetical protein
MNFEKLKYLSTPPFDASVYYFLQTGNVNGELKIAIERLLNEDIESYKKLYNDLAESHAKQVIEIGELKYDKGIVLAEICALKDRLNSDDSDYIDRLESELLKAKELLISINANWPDDPYKKVDEFINKKP